jgi:CHRD domain/Protein of unknown function (DUF3455)
MKHDKRRRTAIAIAVTAVAAGVGTTLAVVPSSADSHHGTSAVRVASKNSMPGMAGMSGMGKGTDTSDQSPELDGGYTSSKPVYFASVLRGANEVPVPNGPAVGDKDGIAVEFMRIQGNQVSFAIKWSGIAAPTAGHVHLGKKGTNGDVKIPFFAEKLPDSLNAVSGSVTVNDAKLLSDLRSDPGGFYFNIHTGEFPGGALRGQVHRLTRPVDLGRALSSFPASVVTGKQIYACTKQTDGTYKFTQNNVAATLDGDIAHSFVHPNAGPPRWVAPDHSGVTGTLVTKTDNGTTNIPELDLLASHFGKRTGELGRTGEVLRLNTVGGVAPAGTCNPHTQPKVGVPYHADYLFVGK